MNLISCSLCCVVLDKDKIIFPSIYDHDTQELIDENAGWSDKDECFKPKVECPVCSGFILDED